MSSTSGRSAGFMPWRVASPLAFKQIAMSRDAPPCETFSSVPNATWPADLAVAFMQSSLPAIGAGTTAMLRVLPWRTALTWPGITWRLGAIRTLDAGLSDSAGLTSCPEALDVPTPRWIS